MCNFQDCACNIVFAIWDHSKSGSSCVLVLTTWNQNNCSALTLSLYSVIWLFRHFRTRLRQRFFLFWLLVEKGPYKHHLPTAQPTHSLNMNSQCQLSCFSSILSNDEMLGNHTTSPRKCVHMHLCTVSKWVEWTLIKAAQYAYGWAF